MHCVIMFLNWHIGSCSMSPSFRLIFLTGTVVLMVFTFFGFLLYNKVVEFGDAFKLAFGISLGILLWLTRKRE